MKALAAGGRPGRAGRLAGNGGLGAGARGPDRAGGLRAGRRGGRRGGQPAAPAPERIVWSTFRGGAENGRWRQMQIERFQAKFPRTRVDLQTLTQRLPQAVRPGGGRHPGGRLRLGPLPLGLLAGDNRRGILRPIDEYVTRDKFDLGQFYKPFIEIPAWDGKLSGLPSWGWTGQDGLLYNTELSQQAGVTFPDPRSPQWTWPALYDTWSS